jgi:hypothetical protein
MNEIKKKAIAKAVVKTIVNNKLIVSSNDIALKSTVNEWSQWGKQTQMINRNIAQMRPRKR